MAVYKVGHFGDSATVKLGRGLHNGDTVDSRQNRRQIGEVADTSTLSPICRRFVESRLSPTRSTLSTVSRSTLSPKLNMFNLVDFVESWWFLSPECRWSFRLCCLCVQGLKPGTNWRQSWQSPKPATNRRQRRLSTLAPYKPHVVGWARGDPIGLEVIKFWCWSESRCWSGIAFPLSLTLQDRTFCSQLGRADLWPLANAVVHTL